MTGSQLHVGLVVEQLWQPVPGGSGTYVLELAHALADREDVVPAGYAARHRTGTSDLDPRVPVHRSPLPRTALYAAWQRLGAPRLDRLGGSPLDVCHATTWAVPPTSRPLAVTVHDVAFLEHPQFFTPHGNRFFRRALDRVATRADAVIVPSAATATQCREAGIDPTRVHVVPHGMRLPDLTPADMASARHLQPRGRPYIMWAGTVEPRKNLPRLLTAYASLGSDAPDLLLVGPSGWGNLPSVPDGVRSRVHLTGRVGAGTLHALYAGAAVFVFPSISEGFGLPVLEAMAHGVPVVTSRGTACAEVLGDAGVTVDPHDPAEIAAGMAHALGPDGARLATAGRVRSAGFRWERSAAQTVSAYRSAIEVRAAAV